VEHLEPALVLKTTPPRTQRVARLRERLSIENPELGSKAAIAVHGAAGFGKTVLLAQWRREVLSRGAVAAWLTLDAHDDGVRFVQGLAAAMAIGSGRSAFAGGVERMQGPGRDEREGLTEWLAEVADLGGEVVLILDEADTLPEATVRHSLTYLLHNAPANLRIVMASRRRLNLQITDLLARGLYGEVDTNALRFGVEETLAILAGRFSTRIDPDLGVRLHEITEGWPLGLQLAITAVEKSANPVTAVEELSACSGDLQRYFVDSLVARLTAEQVDFLVCISLLEMVSPALCIALTSNAHASTMLNDLCATTPIFAEGLDSNWVRLHPLAREFLRGRFAELPLERRQALHGRAASWLEAHAFFEESARQYLSAGQPAQAYAMIEQCLYEIMLRGQFSRVLDWAEELPTQEIERHPRMCLAVAWALAMSERHEQAAKLIACIRTDPSADDAIRCEASAIASAAAYFAGHPDESQRIIAPWLGALPDGTGKLQAIITNQVALLTLLQGQPEKARRIYQRAPAFIWTPELDAIRGFGEWVVGLAYLYEGRIQPAVDSLRDSLARAEQDIGRRSPVAVILASGLAAALFEQDHIQESATVLANRLDVMERLATPDALVMGLLTAARLAVLQGQSHRAHDLLETLFALGEERGIPRFCLVALGEQIRLHAMHGRSDSCLTLWRRLEEALSGADNVEAQGAQGTEMALQVALAGGYVALAQRDWRSLLDGMVSAAELAEHLRRGRDIVQIKLLKALALKALGDDGLPILQEALSLAAEYGLQRIVQDVHPDLFSWVQQVKLANTVPQIEVPLAPTVVPRPEPVKASVSASRLLTPKEREVLQLLARNLSNKQIALALNVGEETVKWHLKNLFGKFQAGTRKHVVDRAYMLGILESTF